MNSQVFDALSVLKVVTSPDLDLRQLLDLQTRADVIAEDLPSLQLRCCGFLLASLEV